MKKTSILFSALLLVGAVFMAGCGTEDNDLPKSVYEGANKQRGQMQPGGGGQPGGGAPGGPPPGTPGTGSSAPQGGTAQPGAGGPPPGTPGAGSYAAPR